jgi:hypothetical protein
LNGNITTTNGNLVATNGSVNAPNGNGSFNAVQTGGTTRITSGGVLNEIESINNISGNWLQITANGGVPVDLITGNSDVQVDTNAGYGLQITTGVLRAGSGNATNIYGGTSGGSNIFFNGAAYNFASLATGAGNGAICATSGGTLRYLSGTGNCGSSSIAYKTNVVSLGDALSVISQLRPVSFDWKASSDETNAAGGSHDFGLIAQEVQPILPELVNYDADGTVHGLNYTAFTPFMMRAIQQEQGEIVALQDTTGNLNSQTGSNSSSISNLSSQLATTNSNVSSNTSSINNLQSSVNNISAQLMSGNFTGITVSGNANIGGNLTVTGQTTLQGKLVAQDAEFDGVLTAAGHIVSKGNAPTITVGDAIGTGDGIDQATDPTVQIAGTDNAGSVTITTGSTGDTDGVLAHLVFAKAYDAGTTYNAVISATNGNATDLRVYIVKTDGGFDIVSKDAPGASQTYTFDYIVLGSQQVASN